MIRYAQENVKKLLVGNKSDIIERRKVTYEEGMELAKQYKIDFIETSAKNSTNIENAFLNLSKNILEKMNNCNQIFKEKNLKLKEGNALTNNANNGAGYGYCC